MSQYGTRLPASLAKATSTPFGSSTALSPGGGASDLPHKPVVSGDCYGVTNTTTASLNCFRAEYHPDQGRTLGLEKAPPTVGRTCLGQPTVGSLAVGFRTAESGCSEAPDPVELDGATDN